MDRRAFLKRGAVSAVAAATITPQRPEATEIERLYRELVLTKEAAEANHKAAVARYQAKEISATEMMQIRDRGLGEAVDLFERMADMPTTCDADTRCKAKALKLLFPHQFEPKFTPRSHTAHAKITSAIFDALTV